MTNPELAAMLLAIVSLLAMAHGCGYVFERFGLPRVGGEITAGLVLGPTALGRFAPEFHAGIFTAFPEQERLVSAVYWIGLILLMFISGFRVQRDLSPRDRRVIGKLVLAALLAPFAVGMLTPVVIDMTSHQGPAANPVSFYLVFAIGFAVTSIPVISKIFIDLRLVHTRFASIVLATATVEDIVLWVALAVATKLAVAQSVEVLPLVRTVAVTVLFLGLSLWLGPRVTRWVSGLRVNLLPRASRTGYVVVICFIFAATAQLLDVNVVFGALVAGILVATLPSREFEPVRERISDVSLGVLIPIYFALVGFRLDLVRDLDVPLAVGFLLASSAVKISCVALGARGAGYRWHTAFDFAMAMNARGGPGIVLGSVAHEFGIIDARLFVALILTAVLTSLASGIWLRRAVAAHRSFDLVDVASPSPADPSAKRAL